MKPRIFIPVASLAILLSAPLQAQESVEEIVVTSHPLHENGVAQATDVLSGDELNRALATSIGTTVGRLPGVHASTFGSASTRPVIHGLGGARVRVMEDRIDTMDASVTSPDHATTVDPFMADRIEVLKGASTLLYGSGAIGGVIDVQTGRIPHGLSVDGIDGRADIRGSDNASMRSLGFRLDGMHGRFAWHVDGFDRSGDEYDIPGFAESAALRAAEEAESEGEGEEGEEGEEEAFGTLPGSQYETRGGAIGFSYIGDRVFAGIAVGAIDSDYGLPGGHGHEEEEGGAAEEEEEGNPNLLLEQIRTDLELAISDPFGPFEELAMRLGINDYEHSEIEPNGEVATLFENDAYEFRLELSHRELAGWAGQLGIQQSEREFSAVGEEAFVPPVDTRDWGAFWMIERGFGAFDLELGARGGRVRHEPTTGPDRSFSTYGISAGIVAEMSSSIVASVQLDASQRAPVAEELYSNGAHLATNTFEVGDATLDEESARNLSVTLNYTGEMVDAVFTAYRSEFNDFIFEAATGDEEDDLPVFQFTQEDANFWGAEAEVSVNLAQSEAHDVVLRLMGDWVNTRLDEGGQLPRIPGARIGVGMDVEWDAFFVSFDVLRAFTQNDNAEFEFETEGYTDLSFYAAYRSEFSDVGVEWFLQGDNLTDSEQRLHTSFIKDFAPQPGRTVTAGVRVAF